LTISWGCNHNSNKKLLAFGLVEESLRRIKRMIIEPSIFEEDKKNDSKAINL